MGRSWQALMGAAAGLMVAGCALSVVGCGGQAPSSSSRPTAAQLKDGLNLLDVSDAKWGMSAAYVSAGRVVYIESRVGPAKPEIYTKDRPGVPLNEMDYRFVDEQNHTFYAVRGGDSFIDPTWASEFNAGRALPPAQYANRDSDFQLAHDAATALALNLPAEFKDHAFHMTDFAKVPLPAQDPLIAARAKVLSEKPLPPEAAYGTYQGYATDVTANAESLYLIASHSATETGYWYSYTTSYSCNCSWWSCHTCHGTGWAVAASLVACNHGDCANTMAYQCETAVVNNSANETASTTSSLTGNNDGQGGCQTAYNWDSGGYDHLCNDDTAYELWQGKGGAWTGWSYSGPADNIDFKYYGSSHCMGTFPACGQSPSYFACDCQSFGGCAGDWNAPWCP
jgi:hypothetical protein